MNRNGNLEFKYDNYEDDIKRKEQPEKEDYNMQTDLNDKPKRSESPEEYAHDFEEDKPSPKRQAEPEEEE